ncbi:MAG TPA: hypothetical protein VIK10_11040 [Prolixibacteraceae bacterium]
MKNISEFGTEYKRLVIMSKRKSPHRILLLTNDPDIWLLDMVEYVHVTGEIVENVGYLSKDIPKLIELRQRQGYDVLQRTKLNGKLFV